MSEIVSTSRRHPSVTSSYPLPSKEERHMYPVFDVVGLLVDRVRFEMFCGNTCDPPKDLRFSDMPNHQKNALPIDLTLFRRRGPMGRLLYLLCIIQQASHLFYPNGGHCTLGCNSFEGVLSRYARSYFVFGSASLVPSLECDLGENLQASQRALVYLPWLATLFAERQPRCQGSPHIDEPARV